MNDNILKILTKKFAMKSRGVCPNCWKKVNTKKFKDDCSRAEFKITGYCQKCQDIIFTEDYWRSNK